MLAACVCVICHTVRECVPLESAFAQRQRTRQSSPSPPSPLTRPLRLSDQTRLSGNATPASPLRFRLRFLSCRVVGFVSPRLGCCCCCTCRRWATAAGERCVSTECQHSGDLPNENCCVHCGRQRLRLQRSPTAAGEGEGGPTAQTATPINVRQRQTERERDRTRCYASAAAAVSAATAVSAAAVCASAASASAAVPALCWVWGRAMGARR